MGLSSVGAAAGSAAELEALRGENETLRAEIRQRDLERTKLLHQQVALRTVLESIPYCVWWKDRDGVYLGCNQKFGGVAGHTPASIVGLTDYDLPWTKAEADHYREDDQAVQ